MPHSPTVSANTRLVGFVFALALLAAACGEEARTDSQSEADVPPVVEEFEGSLTNLVVEEGPGSVLSAKLTVESADDLHARVGAVSPEHTVVTPRTADARSQFELPIVGLRSDTSYDLAVELTDDAGEVKGRGAVQFSTGPLPESMPPIDLATANTDEMSPGLTMFDVTPWQSAADVPGSSPGLYLGIDAAGEVVWYDDIPFSVGDTRITDDGTVLSLFALWGIREVNILGERQAGWEVAPTSGFLGTEAGLAQPVDATDPNGVGPAQTPNGDFILASADYELRSLHHEVQPLPNGNFLTVGTTTDTVVLTDEDRQAFCPDDPAQWLLADEVILEFTRDGEVVQEWVMSELVDPFEVPGHELCSTQGQIASDDLRDWAHINAVVYDEDRNAVIVSSRHIDLVTAFRYAADDEGPSGEVLWNLGPTDIPGTLPLDGQAPYSMHAPEVQADSSILLYDNGNFRPGTGHPVPQVRLQQPEPTDPPFSRAVRYEINDSAEDPAEWRATQVWEHRIDDRNGEPLFAPFLGDADTLDNGNVLINHGGIDQFTPETARARIIEVVPDGKSGGEVVFDATIGDRFVIYRAERVPTLYTGPLWEQPAT